MAVRGVEISSDYISNLLLLSNIIMRAKVFKQLSFNYIMTLKVNRNFALLYGIMLGDGCLSLIYGKKKNISIAGSMKDDIPFLKR